MPRRTRRPGKNYSTIARWCAALATGAVISIVVVIMLRGTPSFRGWFEGVLSGLVIFPVSPPVGGPSSASSIPANLYQADYTELFSGTGWMNPARTTVSQDLSTTVISFPPAYAISKEETLTAALHGARVVAAKGTSAGGTALLTSTGEVVLINPAGGLVGPLRLVDAVSMAALDFDSDSNLWIAAMVTPGGFSAVSFDSRGSVISRVGSEKIENSIAANILDVACVGGKCLIAVGGHMWSFSERFAGLLSDVSSSWSWLSSSSSFVSFSVGKTASAFLVGAVTKSSDDYSATVVPVVGDKWLAIGFQSLVASGQPLITSRYPGVLRFGFDPDTQKLLVLYAAYVAQAYEIPASAVKDSKLLTANDASLATDLSRFFGTRVFGGSAAGSLDVVPTVSGGGGVWWVSSNDSRGLRFMRVEGGLVSDITNSLPDGTRGIVLALGGEAALPLSAAIADVYASNFSKSYSPYIFLFQNGGSVAYRVTDRGFDESAGTLIWESSKLNSKTGNVVKGILIRAEDSNSVSSVYRLPPVAYSLSNNGGLTWYDAKLGVPVMFSTQGNDFRFRVSLVASRQSPVASVSPWVDTVGVQYFEEQ